MRCDADSSRPRAARMHLPGVRAAGPSSIRLWAGRAREHRDRLVSPRPPAARSPGVRGRARRARSRRARLLLRRPAPARPACLRPRTQFMLECLINLDEGLRARLGPGRPPRAPRGRAPGVAGSATASAVHFTARRHPVRRRRGRAAPARRSGRPASNSHDHPGLNAVDDVGDVRTQQGTPYTCLPVSPFLASTRSPSAAAGPARVAAAAVGAGEGKAAVAPGPRALAGGRGPATGRRARGPSRRRPLPRRAGARVPGVHDALGARPYLAPLPLPALRLHHPASARGAPAAGQGAGGLRRQLCWRDSTTTSWFTSPATRGPSSRTADRGKIRSSHAEKAFEGVVEGRPATRWSTPG